ncbi:MAG TPA: homoserine kinase [Pyrinomonadaceae bacterium]
MSDARPSDYSTEVRVPASTSNLGAGFDCFGLALRLYLTVRAFAAPTSSAPCRVRSLPREENSKLPRNTENLIFRVMLRTAERLGRELPPVRLAVRNEIPLGRGLGSSAAAAIAGVYLGARLAGEGVSKEEVLRYATEIEGHPDNVAASLHGGWTIACTSGGGSVLALKKRWPAEVKVVAVSPHAELETKGARALLSQTVSLADAVHNLQRAALFTAALEERAYDLLWEATRDRLHQEQRKYLVPGVAEALSTERMTGLLGLALSGAGPTVVALALGNFEEIGKRIAGCFEKHGVRTGVRLLEVDEEGAVERRK